MYREKLISQIAALEDMQRRCTITDISELVELGKNILSLAKKIDELDENTEYITCTDINGKKVYEVVREYAEDYKEKQGQPKF